MTSTKEKNKQFALRKEKRQLFLQILKLGLATPQQQKELYAKYAHSLAAFLHKKYGCPYTFDGHPMAQKGDWACFDSSKDLIFYQPEILQPDFDDRHIAKTPMAHKIVLLCEVMEHENAHFLDFSWQANAGRDPIVLEYKWNSDYYFLQHAAKFNLPKKIKYSKLYDTLYHTHPAEIFANKRSMLETSNFFAELKNFAQNYFPYNPALDKANIPAGTNHITEKDIKNKKIVDFANALYQDDQKWFTYGYDEYLLAPQLKRRKKLLVGLKKDIDKSAQRLLRGTEIATLTEDDLVELLFEPDLYDEKIVDAFIHMNKRAGSEFELQLWQTLKQTHNDLFARSGKCQEGCK